MKIGLVDIDGGGKKKKWGATIYPNIALGKISRWYKERGDEVEWAIPFVHYDKVYMSKIFNFSVDDLTIYDADEVVKGGTGYDIYSRLPEVIDRMQPDYSIYPNVPSNTAYGFLTRGCPNKCKWCVVPRKEGVIRPYMDVDEIAIEGRKNLVLMDNNILAAGDYMNEQLEKAIKRGYRLDFNQAMDARLVTEDIAELLARVKWIKLVRFGCDTHRQIDECEKAIEMMRRYGYNGEFFLYTMLTDDFNECYERTAHWWKVTRNNRANHGARVLVFAQPYRDPDNPHRPIPQWQKDMAQWCNKKQYFTQFTFEEFSPRKGFRCAEYLKL